jgi:hypothetical protein
MSSSIYNRLKALEQDGTAYELDYITMTDGFIYRRARVLQLEEESLFISSEAFPEAYLKASEIASFRINRL